MHALQGSEPMADSAVPEIQGTTQEVALAKVRAAADKVGRHSSSA
jgi:hypothetical protein